MGTHPNQKVIGLVVKSGACGAIRFGGVGNSQGDIGDRMRAVGGH